MIFFVLFFIQGCAYKHNKSHSIHSIEADEQKVFNAIKQMFRNGSGNEFIIDTHWDSLIVTKRETIYLPFLHMEIKQTVYQIDANATDKSINYELKVYTQIGEGDKRYLDENSYIHTLFWNRVEYALGSDEWLSCLKATSLSHYGSFLCNISPQSLR